MTAAYTGNVSTPGGVLHLAFELGWTHWKLAFTIGYGQKPRQRTIAARDLAALEQEIAKAKDRGPPTQPSENTMILEEFNWKKEVLQSAEPVLVDF